MESIIVAVITGGMTLIGSLMGIISQNRSQSSEIKREMDVHQAVTDEKISTLASEVGKHNGFAQRLPVVEEQIKVINHRIEDLENAAK